MSNQNKTFNIQTTGNDPKYLKFSNEKLETNADIECASLTAQTVVTSDFELVQKTANGNKIQLGEGYFQNEISDAQKNIVDTESAPLDFSDIDADNKKVTLSDCEGVALSKRAALEADEEHSAIEDQINNNKLNAGFCNVVNKPAFESVSFPMSNSRNYVEAQHVEFDGPASADDVAVYRMATAAESKNYWANGAPAALDAADARRNFRVEMKVTPAASNKNADGTAKVNFTAGQGIPAECHNAAQTGMNGSGLDQAAAHVNSSNVLPAATGFVVSCEAAADETNAEGAQKYNLVMEIPTFAAATADELKTAQNLSAVMAGPAYGHLNMALRSSIGDASTNALSAAAAPAALQSAVNYADKQAAFDAGLFGSVRLGCMQPATELQTVDCSYAGVLNLPRHASMVSADAAEKMKARWCDENDAYSATQLVEVGVPQEISGFVHYGGGAGATELAIDLDVSGYSGNLPLTMTFNPTSSYISEQSWTLRDASGATLASGTPPGTAEYSVTVDVACGQVLVLTLEDSWGDGWGWTGAGGLVSAMLDAGTSIIAQTTQHTFSDIEEFMRHMKTDAVDVPETALATVALIQSKSEELSSSDMALPASMGTELIQVHDNDDIKLYDCEGIDTTQGYMFGGITVPVEVDGELTINLASAADVTPETQISTDILPFKLLSNNDIIERSSGAKGAFDLVRESSLDDIVSELLIAFKMCIKDAQALRRLDQSHGCAYDFKLKHSFTAKSKQYELELNLENKEFAKLQFRKQECALTLKCGDATICNNAPAKCVLAFDNNGGDLFKTNDRCVSVIVQRASADQLDSDTECSLGDISFDVSASSSFEVAARADSSYERDAFFTGPKNRKQFAADASRRNGRYGNAGAQSFCSATQCGYGLYLTAAHCLNNVSDLTSDLSIHIDNMNGGSVLVKARCVAIMPDNDAAILQVAEEDMMDAIDIPAYPLAAAFNNGTSTVSDTLAAYTWDGISLHSRYLEAQTVGEKYHPQYQKSVCVTTDDVTFSGASGSGIFCRFGPNKEKLTGQLYGGYNEQIYYSVLSIKNRIAAAMFAGRNTDEEHCCCETENLAGRTIPASGLDGDVNSATHVSIEASECLLLPTTDADGAMDKKGDLGHVMSKLAEHRDVANARFDNDKTSSEYNPWDSIAQHSVADDFEIVSNVKFLRAGEQFNLALNQNMPDTDLNSGSSMFYNACCDAFCAGYASVVMECHSHRPSAEPVLRTAADNVATEKYFVGCTKNAAGETITHEANGEAHKYYLVVPLTAQRVISTNAHSYQNWIGNANAPAPESAESDAEQRKRQERLDNINMKLLGDLPSDLRAKLCDKRKTILRNM